MTTMGDLEIICRTCAWPPREAGRFVPHDGPCGEECEEDMTGCHCAQPDPIPNPLYRGRLEIAQ